MNEIYEKNSNNLIELNPINIEYSADKSMIGKNINTNRLSKEYTDKIYEKYYFRDFMILKIHSRRMYLMNLD